MRSGLGFGGALFTLPLLLLVDNRPVVYLALIAVHLLFFTSLTFAQNAFQRKRQGRKADIFINVDWAFLKKVIPIMIIPKLIGVFGLLTLPDNVMSIIIFSIVCVYSFNYILNKNFAPKNKFVEWIFLMLGGYISGTSLIGAPLIVAVAAHQIDKSRLRDTLFVLWFFLVCIKMAVFLYSGVNLWLLNHVWLIPCVFIGHLVGLKAHNYLLTTETSVFYRVIGSVLLATSVVGLASNI